ncbi:YetF domain-containing protein [Clostridium sardiniense]|uniref:YetF domain-containing protein n=1 Tax=Clostridium sardiniense TaxID=29369 RepID=UPI002ED2E2CA
MLPRILISDGKINKNSLTRIGEDKAWIENKLKEYGIDSIKKVLIALYDTQGNFKYQLFDKYEKESKK